MPETIDSRVDDADLLAWLDDALAPRRRAEVDALLARSPAARDLLFALAMGPPAAFRSRFRVGEPPVAEGTDIAYALDGPFGGLRAAMDAADADGPPVYGCHGQVDLVLRPAHRRASAPPAALFIAREDGPLKRSMVAPQVAPNGAMRIKVAAADLFAGGGRYTLALALGEADDERFEGLSLSAARARRPDLRWLAADCFFDPDD